MIKRQLFELNIIPGVQLEISFVSPSLIKNRVLCLPSGIGTHNYWLENSGHKLLDKKISPLCNPRDCGEPGLHAANSFVFTISLDLLFFINRKDSLSYDYEEITQGA